METPFDNMLAALERVEDEVRQFVEQTASSPAIANVLTNLNRAQLSAGLRADDSEITPEYTPYTKFLKDQKGQPSDRVTLRDEGDFYADLRVDADPLGLRIIDVNSKDAALRGKYGDDILGVNDDGIQRVIDLLKPIVQGQVENVIKPKLLER